LMIKTVENNFMALPAQFPQPEGKAGRA
jgi:hypothetical protein